MTTPLQALNVEECRKHFPSLNSGFIFADNAGGSQCLKEVADRATDYLLNTNVQLGAGYSISIATTRRIRTEATGASATLMNAESPSEISFGSSSTMMVDNLARAMEADVKGDEEFIVSFADHEANVGPWVNLGERKGIKVVPWLPRRNQHPRSNPNPFDLSLRVEELESLITSKTRLVAFTACSNLLGEFVDVKAVVETIRRVSGQKGARKTEVCVDGVGYAPHRRIDVQDWDVDYCFISYYKAFGPHTSAIYTRKQALDGSLASLAHYFLDNEKIEPGGPGYELTYATTGVLSYLLSLSGRAGNGNPAEQLEIAFTRILQHEERLQKPLITYLLSKYSQGVRIVGPESYSIDIRAPTVSFVIVDSTGTKKRVQSKDVVAKFDATGDIGIRYGHSYAHRLLGHCMGMDPGDGVIRISLLHYNTVEEVARIISILEDVI